jgi:hypothetical protein
MFFDELFELSTDKVRHLDACNLLEIVINFCLFLCELVFKVIIQLLSQQKLPDIDLGSLNCSALADIVFLPSLVNFAFGALGRLFLLCKGSVEGAFAPVLAFG